MAEQELFSIPDYELAARAQLEPGAPRANQLDHSFAAEAAG